MCILLLHRIAHRIALYYESDRPLAHCIVGIDNEARDAEAHSSTCFVILHNLQYGEIPLLILRAEEQSDTCGGIQPVATIFCSDYGCFGRSIGSEYPISIHHTNGECCIVRGLQGKIPAATFERAFARVGVVGKNERFRRSSRHALRIADSKGSSLVGSDGALVTHIIYHSRLPIANQRLGIMRLRLTSRQKKKKNAR